MSGELRASTVLVAVDARSRDVAAAEHLVRLLDGLLPVSHPAYVASTHVVTGRSGSHLAVAASWTLDPRGGEATEQGVELLARVRQEPDLEDAAAVVVLAQAEAGAIHGSEEFLAGARAAAAQHGGRSAGRLARYPGRSDIERRVTVAEVLAGSAVDAVEGLAGTTVDDVSELDLTDWARPTWRAGRVVLLVQPAAGALVPFEARHQIACCADH
jgi:hypothetical protein